MFFFNYFLVSKVIIEKFFEFMFGEGNFWELKEFDL